MSWMLNNSSGQPDSMFTFSVVGLVTTVLSIFLSVFSGTELLFGDQKLVLQSPDVTMVSAFLGATVTAYVLRKNKKDQHQHELKMKEVEIKELTSEER